MDVNIKKWSKLSADQKEFWLDAARKEIYPDFRSGYLLHDKMINSLARGIYECYQYSKFGDASDKSQKSIIDYSEDN